MKNIEDTKISNQFNPIAQEQQFFLVPGNSVDKNQWISGFVYVAFIFAKFWFWECLSVNCYPRMRLCIYVSTMEFWNS